MAQEGPIASPTIVPGSITPVTSDRLLGRDTAGSGAAEQLTVGGGLEFTGSGGIQRSALSGDISASAGSGTTAIGADKVTDAMLRNSAAVSVIGRSANSAGDPADIAAAADGDVLRRAANAVGFGAIPVASVTGAAPLASPTFTGTPAAPTADAGTTTTQLATTEFVTTKHGHRYQIPATWYRLNIARNLTNDDIERHKADAAFANTWPAPRNGAIVGITARVNVALIAGSMDVMATIDGSETGLTLSMNSLVNASGGTATGAATIETYSAGANIGVSITTDGSLLPDGTDDIEVWLEVQEAGSE